MTKNTSNKEFKTITDTDIQVLKDKTRIESLVSLGTLKKVSSTGGGEYSGPCPFCGGTDRFSVQPLKDKWLCRKCSNGWQDVINFYMRANGDCKFPVAFEALGGIATGSKAYKKTPPKVGAYVEASPPKKAWQDSGGTLLSWAMSQLWGNSSYALDYLHNRGLTDDTLLRYDVGYNPVNFDGRKDSNGDLLKNSQERRDRIKWGLDVPVNATPKEQTFYIPRGFVIPWMVNESVWGIDIRRLNEDIQALGCAKYHAVTGSVKRAIWGIGDVKGRKAVIIVETEFDAMLVNQIAGDYVHGIATGGVTCGRAKDWLKYLVGVPLLLAFDSDKAGVEASKYWQGMFKDAVIMETMGKDVGEMVTSGVNILTWIKEALAGVKGWVDPMPTNAVQTAKPTTTKPTNPPKTDFDSLFDGLEDTGAISVDDLPFSDDDVSPNMWAESNGQSRLFSPLKGEVADMYTYCVSQR